MIVLIDKTIKWPPLSKRLATVGRKNSLLRPPVEPGVSENTQTLWEGRRGVVAPTAAAHKQTGVQNKCSLYLFFSVLSMTFIKKRNALILKLARVSVL